MAGQQPRPRARTCRTTNLLTSHLTVPVPYSLRQDVRDIHRGLVDRGATVLCCFPTDDRSCGTAAGPPAPSHSPAHRSSRASLRAPCRWSRSRAADLPRPARRCGRAASRTASTTQWTPRADGSDPFAGTHLPEEGRRPARADASPQALAPRQHPDDGPPVAPPPARVVDVLHGLAVRPNPPNLPLWCVLQASLPQASHQNHTVVRRACGHGGAGGGPAAVAGPDERLRVEGLLQPEQLVGQQPERVIGDRPEDPAGVLRITWQGVRPSCLPPLIGTPATPYGTAAASCRGRADRRRGRPSSSRSRPASRWTGRACRRGRSCAESAPCRRRAFSAGASS